MLDTRGRPAEAAARAEREEAFREINERITMRVERFEHLDTMVQIAICECSDEKCVERVRHTPKEYRFVRSKPSRFLIAPRHNQADIERVRLPPRPLLDRREARRLVAAGSGRVSLGSVPRRSPPVDAPPGVSGGVPAVATLRVIRVNGNAAASRQLDAFDLPCDIRVAVRWWTTQRTEGRAFATLGEGTCKTGAPAVDTLPGDVARPRLPVLLRFGRERAPPDAPSLQGWPLGSSLG